MSIAGLCFLCCLLGAGGAWAICCFADRLGLLDCPNARSSHCTPVPKGGGIGILGAFIFSCWVLALPGAFWLPAAALSIMGLASDRVDIPPIPRLIVQFGMAGLFVVMTSAAQDLATGWLGSVLTMSLLAVLVVGTANLYNFMDGINGIAGVTGVVGFGLMGAFASTIEGREQYALLSFAIASGCMGFLPFNLRRSAKVFMGDVGSILLGFVFAALTLLIAQGWSDLFCLLSFLFPFYADEVSTMALRIKDGENLTHAHRRHLYQILANELEFEHWKISVAYSSLQLGVGLLIWTVWQRGLGTVMLILGGLFAGFVAASTWIRRIP